MHNVELSSPFDDLLVTVTGGEAKRHRSLEDLLLYEESRWTTSCDMIVGSRVEMFIDDSNWVQVQLDGYNKQKNMHIVHFVAKEVASSSSSPSSSSLTKRHTMYNVDLSFGYHLKDIAIPNKRPSRNFFAIDLSKSIFYIKSPSASESARIRALDDWREARLADPSSTPATPPRVSDDSGVFNIHSNPVRTAMYYIATSLVHFAYSGLILQLF